MPPIVIALLGLLVWIGACFGVGYLLGLKGTMLYLFLGILSALGIVAAAVFVWWKQKQAAQAGGARSSGDQEIDNLAKEADARLAASKSAPGAKIGTLPLVFVMGENGSVKTTSIVHSGLEPELVSGQVYQDTNIVATRFVNLFLARNTVFADASGSLVSDQGRWQRFVRRMAPGQLRSVVGGSEQVPRAAIVCFDIEKVLTAGGESVTASARALNARLGDIAQQLGISFPVYVLFTRIDRLPFFHDFAANLSNEEALQVFGSTVAIPKQVSQGIYAEEATAKWSEAFGNLIHSLCDKRLLYLPRENDPAKLPGAYEFAREFRKLRTPVVQFLVDLCRPSQLRTSPFLRGFYFSGVRPVIIDDSAGLRAAREQHPSAMEAASSATKVFKLGPGGLVAQPPAGTPSIGATRKVPQWTFLGRLFNDVILGDREAMAASGTSTRTNTAQRALLASVAALALVLLTGFTISFAGNRSLESEAIEAARNMSSVNAADLNALPEVASLERLETLRQTLDTLSVYERDGAPYRLRWGLYSGDDMYPEVRKVWCQKFTQQLLGPAAASIASQLRRLPAAPSPGDDYGSQFSNLRTYLTVTAYEDKASREQTGPALLAAWMAGRNPDEQRVQLARQQFDFYGGSLRSGACPLSFNADAVANGRRYLAGFSGVDSIYQSMLAAANRQNKPVNFNRDIKGSDVVVVNNRDVAGVFTRPGFATMSEFIKNPDPFFGGEKWVLCGEPGQQRDTARTACSSQLQIDRAQLAQALTTRYGNDYIKAWQTYMRNSSLRRYADLDDAARKLDILSNNTTPLMALFWLATQHTAVENDRIKAAFQPVQEVVPPPATLTKYIYEEKNGPYIDSLTKLQKGVADAAVAKNDLNIANQTVGIAGDARMMVKSVARRFNPDPAGQIDQVSARLLEDPILQVERMLRGAGRDEMNAAGAGMCRGFNALASKFPFNPTSKVDATLEETGKVFHPNDGLLGVFYKDRLQKYLRKEGGQYVPTNEPGPIQMNPAFVRFFGDAMRFGDMMYPGGSATPQLKYTLTPVKSDVVQGSTVRIDGQTGSFGPAGGGKLFTWPAPGGQGEARISVKASGGTEFTTADERGLWGVFHFFADADNQTPSGNNFILEWVPRQGRRNEPIRVGDKELRYKFQVDVPVFSKQFFSAMRCVSTPAK